jgi:hypothetical protein
MYEYGLGVQENDEIARRYYGRLREFNRYRDRALQPQVQQQVVQPQVVEQPQVQA